MPTIEADPPTRPDTPQATRASKASAKVPARVCLHCGVPTGHPEEAFCCSGCAYVYRLINEAGLTAYYQIKDKVIAPADAALLPLRDYAWLEVAQADAERVAGESTPELRLDVQGISCAGCVWLIERIFNKQLGAGRIEINAPAGQLRLLWQTGTFRAAEFARTLQSFNYLVGPASTVRSAPPESRGLVKRIGLCAAFSMNVMLFTLPTYFGMEATFTYAPLFGTLSMAFATLSLLAGGGYFLGKAARSLQLGVVSIDLPIALGIVGAYGGSFFGWIVHNEVFVYFDFVSTFILLMLVGRWAQLAAVERNQRRLLAEQPIPSRLSCWTAEGAKVNLAPEQLTTGVRFAVGPGQTVPVEARLSSPEASVSLAWINGEAAPRTFQSGQRIPSGAVNLTRSEMVLVALQGWRESLLAELTRPVSRAPYRHRFIECVIKGYLISIIAIAFAAGVAWYWATGDGLRSCSVVTAVLVVSCPCAIGLAFPLADEIAAVALRKRGVFVRVGDLWPRLARVRKLVFDKTGTLTLETPKLRENASVANLGELERRVLTRLVEDNLHPVARSLHDAVLAGPRPVPLETAVEEVIGQGVSLQFAGTEWRLGRPAWAMERSEALTRELVEEAVETMFARAGEPIACFSFVEAVRSDVREELRRLQARSLRVMILSGDRRQKVERLSKELGLDSSVAQGEMSPRAKADWLEASGANDALMLGDGANDSLAFDYALCRGTPVVHRGVLTEKADFYYLGRGIAGVRALFEVNDARRRTQILLLTFSIVYNLAAVGLATAGKMNPLIAAILMPTSSLITLGIVALGMRSVWSNSAAAIKQTPGNS